MLNTIKCTLMELVRLPGIMVWSLAFPLILMGIFSMMFGPLEDMAAFDPIRIAVVEVDEGMGDADGGSNAAVAEAQAFAAFMDAVSTGEDRLFQMERADTAAEAERMVREAGEDDPLLGYVQLVDGVPEVHITDALSRNSMDSTGALILTTVMDEYVVKAALLKGLLADDPAALADPAVTASIFAGMEATEVVDVTRDQPKETVRYYFALLGMAALFGASVSLVACQRMRPNLSALGARRSVGGLSYGKAMAGTLIACWILNFGCLAIAYGALRFGIGISFGGRGGACLAVVAAASLMALTLGCAVSAIPKIPESSKSGILTMIACFSALFAGLYGQPTMELADMIAVNAPWVTWINPASQIAQGFYSVMYYDSLAPLFAHLGALAAMAAVFFALAVGSLRRQRYASI